MKKRKLVGGWMRRAAWALLWAGAVALGPPRAGEGAGGTEAEVRVMSFNIRYGTAEDGENHWNARKEFVVDAIRRFNPDLLGTQETLGFQRDYLAEEMPQYGVVGVGRDDGAERGEMMALFYRRDRFEKAEEGHFWLSETPDEPGSRSWDSSLPRMVTWVELTDRARMGGPAVFFFNTHFDHLGVQARRESARLLSKRIAGIAGDAPVVVTGDFNAPEASDPYRQLFGLEPAESGGQRARLVDAYRAAHPARDSHEGTFSGFNAAANGTARIDWIGVSSHWKVLEAAIDRTQFNGRTPSDHFPVTVVLVR